MSKHTSTSLTQHWVQWVLTPVDLNSPKSWRPSVMVVWSTFYMAVCFPFCWLQVQKLAKNEVLMVNIGSLSTGGRVQAVRADLAKIGLTNPVCTEIGEKIALSRRVEKHWRWVLVCQKSTCVHGVQVSEEWVSCSFFACIGQRDFLLFWASVISSVCNTSTWIILYHVNMRSSIKATRSLLTLNTSLWWWFLVCDIFSRLSFCTHTSLFLRKSVLQWIHLTWDYKAYTHSHSHTCNLCC